MGGAKRYPSTSVRVMMGFASLYASCGNREIVARHAPRRRGIQYAAAYRFNH